MTLSMRTHFKYLAIFLCFCFLSVHIFAANFVSAQSGNFSVGSTWVGSVAPSSAGDTWTIMPGHTVLYDVDNSAGAGWGVVTNNGILLMSNSITCYFKQNANMYGTNALWEIGSAITNIDYTSANLPGIAIEFPGTGQILFTNAGALQWFGTTNKCYSEYLTNTVSIGANSITLSNIPPGLGSNDVFWLQRQNVSGQGGEEYFITNVTGNTISFNVPASGNTGTNTWSGTAFTGSIPTYQRTNGCWISFLSAPIVFYDKAARSTSVVTASGTNTIQGVRFQNLGKGFATSALCSGWTVTSCTVNNCSNGGLGYSSCSGWTVTSCTVNNCSYGGLGYSSCLGWTVTSCTVNNCTYGGLGYNSCSGWTVTSCTVNNCTYGGLGDNSCSGWTVTSCTVNNCSNGGLGDSSCLGWTVTSCTANNCSNGGLGYNSCSGWTVTSCTVNNCTSGGLGYNVCSGWTCVANVNNNSSPLFKQCWDIRVSLSTSSGDTTYMGADSHYALIQYDFTNWFSDGGFVQQTNVLGTTCFAHIIATNAPTPLAWVFSTRPYSSRVVVVSAYSTNSVGYYASVMNLEYAYPTNQILFLGTNTTGFWTNYQFTVTNPSNHEIDNTVWLDARGTNGAVGYSKVTIGPDLTTTVQ